MILLNLNSKPQKAIVFVHIYRYMARLLANRRLQLSAGNARYDRRAVASTPKQCGASSYSSAFGTQSTGYITRGEPPTLIVQHTHSASAQS